MQMMINSKENEVSKQLDNWLNTGIIDINVARKIREEMHKKKVEETLKNHKYKIWQGTGKDKRWKTHVPPNHLIIAKPTKEELVEALVEYYENINKKDDKSTLKTLYSKWLRKKALYTKSSNYIRRIDNEWNRFYKNSDIVDKPLKELTSVMLDEWIHKTIKENHLTKKKFYNMGIILKEELKYAVELGLIPSNPLEKVEIKKTIFEREARKPAKTQVFLVDEQKKLEKAAYQDFHETNSANALAIIFALQTGLRIGEMVALKYSDIQDDYLYVNRMEVRNQCQDEKGFWKNCEYTIVEHTKSEAGNRKIYLTSKAKEILNLIKETNTKNGFTDGDYIFVDMDGRIHVRALDYRIRKCCKLADIDIKSFHKLRKTYISTLIEHNVNIDLVREIVGHEDARTTYKNYCYNTQTEDMTKKTLEKALCG